VFEWLPSVQMGQSVFPRGMAFQVLAEYDMAMIRSD
jgi:hypothetical protein